MWLMLRTQKSGYTTVHLHSCCH